LSVAALLVATVLLDFDDAAEVSLWRPVDDVVMGGASCRGPLVVRAMTYGSRRAYCPGIPSGSLASC
jgi:hypothetical protein